MKLLIYCSDPFLAKVLHDFDIKSINTKLTDMVIDARNIVIKTFSITI